MRCGLVQECPPITNPTLLRSTFMNMLSNECKLALLLLSIAVVKCLALRSMTRARIVSGSRTAGVRLPGGKVTLLAHGDGIVSAILPRLINTPDGTDTGTGFGKRDYTESNDLVSDEALLNPWWTMGRREAVAGTAATLLGGTSLVQSSPIMSAEAPFSLGTLEAGDALVRNMWLGRLAYPTLVVALEVGLFEALKDKKLSMDELGSRLTPKLRGDGLALEALTSVLASFGLLNVNSVSGRVTIHMTEPARAVLLKESPYFWGSQLLASDGLTASLRRALQLESSPNKKKKVAYAAHSDAAVDSFIESMQSHSAVTADATASALEIIIGTSSPEPASHVLDMAGGSGCFACALTKRNPELRVTLADLPPVVARWRRQRFKKLFTMKFFQGQNRIKTVASDMFDTSTWPRGADVVLLANVIHDWGEHQVLEILRGAHSVLSDAPRGSVPRIVIVEQLLSDDRMGPAPAALASMSMLLGDWRNGKQYSLGELSALLTRAGFHRVEQGPECGKFHHAIIATIDR